MSAWLSFLNIHQKVYKSIKHLYNTQKHPKPPKTPKKQSQFKPKNIKKQEVRTVSSRTVGGGVGGFAGRGTLRSGSTHTSSGEIPSVPWRRETKSGKNERNHGVLFYFKLNNESWVCETSFEILLLLFHQLTQIYLSKWPNLPCFAWGHVWATSQRRWPRWSDASCVNQSSSAFALDVWMFGEEWWRGRWDYELFESL